MSQLIKWTPNKVEALRKAHGEAVKNQAEEFTFDGHDFDTGYANYLLQYLDQLFNPNQNGKDKQ